MRFSRPVRGGSLFHLLRQGEISGQWPTSLLTLPPHFCARIDSENVREAVQRPGLATLLLQLEQKLALRQHNALLEVSDLAKLVTKIGARVCESAEQRFVFLTCHGDALLMQLLLQLVPQHAAALEPLAPVINETIQILAELAISDPHQAEALSTQRPLLSLLFRLTGDKHTVDAALTLAQELLAVGSDIFPLSSVPQLPQLLVSLSPRGLSLVGRALAVLLAKAAEQTMDGVPAPECVAPDLCASCANNRLLLAIPSLLSRIIALLRLRGPPSGLWGHMLAQLPNAQGLTQQWQDEQEQGWSQLGESGEPSPQLVVLISQVPPALRELLSTNPSIMAGPNAAAVPAVFQTDAQESLHLSSLQTALWCTLQADLLYVLWALMGGKTKAKAQQQLVGLGLLDVLQGMFNRLDWRPPSTAHHVQHGAGCTCSPQSCLQMQLLRTLQVLCEKESDQLSYHRLLLLSRNATDSATSYATRSSQASAPSSSPIRSEESSTYFSSIAADAPPRDCLLFAIMELLLQQPSDSVYLLGLASCVHKWVQASSAAEQMLVASYPGFIDFVLKQLLCEPTPPEPQLQVFFDLLAELLKFNPPLLVTVQRQLASGPEGPMRTRALTERLSSHIVDASIFVQCVTLTLNASTSPRRGCKALADLGIDCHPPHAADVCIPEAHSEAETRHASARHAHTSSSADPGSSDGDHANRGEASGRRGSEAMVGGAHEDGTTLSHECVVVKSTPFSAAFAHIGDGGNQDNLPPDEVLEIDPKLHKLLTTPLPLPQPAPPDILETAAAGEIARYIVEHEVDLTLRLMGTVQVSEVSVETMCVINAAIVFFLIAERRGDRKQLMEKVLEAAATEDAKLGPISSFLKLLGFWGEVYHSHSCERRFLEFSSGVPFDHWRSLVDNLKADLQGALEAVTS